MSSPSAILHPGRLDSFLQKRPPGVRSERIQFVMTFALVGLGALAGYDVVYFMLGDVLNFWVHLAIFLSIAGMVVYLQQTGDLELAGSWALVTSFFLFSYLLVNGGYKGTGLFYPFLFPGLAFYIKGRVEGAVWLSYFFVCIAALAAAEATQLIELAFSAETITQLTIAVFINSALIYFYQTINETDESLLSVRNQALTKANEQLGQKIQEMTELQGRQEKLIDKIDTTIVGVQQKNQELEDAKRAMLNVLEDLEDAKAKVEQDKAKNEAMLSSLGEGLIATDERGTIVVMNHKAEEVLGLAASQAIGQPLATILPVKSEKTESIAPEERELAIALREQKAITKTDLLYQRQDGSWFPVAATAAPVNQGGAVIGAILVFRDITEEREIDKTKSEFVSLASHQLRTPLSAIRWFAEMLGTGDAGKLTEEQQQYVAQITESNERMIQLVNALLNVSRIELGSFIIEPKPTNAIEVVQSLLQELQVDIDHKQLEVRTEIDPSLPVINADPSLLRILLQNLLTNAVKYTPEHGTVTVTLRTNGSELVYAVADTGIGIPKEQLHRITEKMFRADNVLKTDTDGNGLGLYLVKSILTSVGGTFAIDSELNKGTTVTITLPLSGMKAKSGTRRLS